MGPSPGRDPDSPRPRREQSRGKGEPAKDSAQTRGPETPPQAAHTSAAVRSAPGTGVLSADPARGCDLRPVPRAARQNPRLAGRPARDAGHGAPATEHGPGSGSGSPISAEGVPAGHAPGTGAPAWGAREQRPGEAAATGAEGKGLPQSRPRGPPLHDSKTRNYLTKQQMQTLSLCTAIPGVQTPPFAEKPPQAPRYGVHVTLNRKLPLYPEYRLPQEAFPDCSVKLYAHTARSFQVLQTLPRLKLCFPRSRDCDRDATPRPAGQSRASRRWRAGVGSSRVAVGGGGGGMANASCRESCWDRLELRLVLTQHFRFQAAALKTHLQRGAGANARGRSRRPRS